MQWVLGSIGAGFLVCCHAEKSRAMHQCNNLREPASDKNPCNSVKDLAVR